MYKEIADMSGSTRSNLFVSLKISSDLEVNGNSKFSILESSKIILRSFSRFLRIWGGILFNFDFGILGFFDLV